MENKMENFMMTHSVPKADIELWVKEASKIARFEIDWHYCGGRVIIKTGGNVNKAYAALKQCRHIHDEASKKFHSEERHHKLHMEDVWGDDKL